MSKTIVVGGFGPGISSAVAERFGREGFSVALVGRNKERLAAGVKALEAKGVKAEAFPTNLADPSAVRALVDKVRTALGPITVLHWNAYGSAAGDLLTADDAAIRGMIDLGVTGLVAAVQAALPDLRKSEESAILVTNGGFGYYDPQVDAAAVKWGAMGLAVANAAKHKTVGLLAEKLKGEKVYVGEVMVTGTVKGSAYDSAGQGNIEPSAVAEKFWSLYKARADVTAQV